MSVQSLNLKYACEMRSEELMYLGKAFKYLFHIFLKVLLKYAISFINYKALQNYRDTQSSKGDQSVMVYWHSWPWIMFSILAFPYGEITDGTRDQASKLMPTNIWAAQPSTPDLLGFAPGLGPIKGKMFWDHPIQTVCLKHIFPSENIILNFRDGRESGTNNFKLPKQFSADFLKKIVTPDKLNP